jgi:hypothetical protein
MHGDYRCGVNDGKAGGGKVDAVFGGTGFDFIFVSDEDELGLTLIYRQGGTAD